MYKTPFKSENPSLDMILTQGNHNLWTKMQKNHIFTIFDLHYSLKIGHSIMKNV